MIYCTTHTIFSLFCFSLAFILCSFNRIMFRYHYFLPTSATFLSLFFFFGFSTLKTPILLCWCMWIETHSVLILHWKLSSSFFFLISLLIENHFLCMLSEKHGILNIIWISFLLRSFWGYRCRGVTHRMMNQLSILLIIELFAL